VTLRGPRIKVILGARRMATISDAAAMITTSTRRGGTLADD
jgi:hypothetical protein